jgi:AraC-like DNA-binding protein
MIHYEVLNMQYRRRVRSHYPAHLVELAEALSLDCNTRDVCVALSIPPSTLYRWISSAPAALTRFHAGWTKAANSDIAHYLGRLIRSCEKSGFDVRSNIAQLIPCVVGDSSQPMRTTENGTYDFLGELPDQIIVGQFTFPRGKPKTAEKTLHFIDFSSGTSAPSLRGQLLLAKMEIDQHYYTRLSCDALARKIGMTKYNFIRAFKAAFSIPPYQYLNQVRVDHARHMLALSRQPLPMIAASVGFSSATSLARAFKRFLGASPANVIHKVAPAVAVSPRSIVEVKK